MKKKLAMKVCALALTTAMIGTMAGCGNDSGNTGSSQSGSSEDSQSSSASSDTASDAQDGSGEESSDEATPPEGEAADGEETYDFGGATIKVSGAYWYDLSEENSENASYIKAHDLLPQLEEKYNVKIEYVKLEGDDGYNTTDMIQSTILSGECYADLFSGADIIALGDYLVDNTETSDFLEIGSIYLEPATWNGHTYGFSCENVGNVMVMTYSRDYLSSIGMDVTPTDKFLAGEWSYDDCKEYLTELKSKLPEGTYPICIHSNTWTEMAPAANGSVSIDSNGEIHLTDEAYIEAIEFYRELIDLGLAKPIPAERNEDGSISSEQGGEQCTATEAKDCVISTAEHWYMDSLEGSLGSWGIVPWPWGSNVTCEGDYTTLSDNYHTAHVLWTDMVAVKSEYRSEGAKNIPDDVLLKIGLDWCDMNDPVAASVRHAAFEAEKNGQEYQNLGYEAGTMRSFSTKEDADLYDWMHSRAIIDWGRTLNSYVRVYRNALAIIALGDDGRASSESFAQAGQLAMDEAFK
ncbi:MAG TPA: hypothetical protein DCZ91_07745 [Lachnospiraceae bacterium]|nr:hypothetical protein [Lachnospiraceae bacterium]